MPNDSIYPTEQTPASETVAGTDKDDASSAEEIKQEFMQRVQEYGVDKPQRRHVRATVIHD